MASLSADALAIGSRRRQIPWAERYVNILGPLVMIMALCLVMAFADPRFFRLQNIMIILQDASIFMVLAMGMTLVITGRGIDLSIGSIATLSAVIMAMLIKDAGIQNLSELGIVAGRRSAFRIADMQREGWSQFIHCIDQPIKAMAIPKRFIRHVAQCYESERLGSRSIRHRQSQNQHHNGNARAHGRLPRYIIVQFEKLLNADARST